LPPLVTCALVYAAGADGALSTATAAGSDWYSALSLDDEAEHDDTDAALIDPVDVCV